MDRSLCPFRWNRAAPRHDLAGVAQTHSSRRQFGSRDTSGRRSASRRRSSLERPSLGSESGGTRARDDSPRARLVLPPLTRRKREDTHMMDRRTFAMLLAGSIEAPRLSWGQGAARGRTMFYASVGGNLTHYSTDVDDASLVKRNTVTLPANIQYAWPHPSKQYLYIVSSGGGPGVAPHQKFFHACPLDPAPRALLPPGHPQNPPLRPIPTNRHTKGRYLLTAYN